MHLTITPNKGITLGIVKMEILLGMGIEMRIPVLRSAF
jgi:hypothetical protein